MFRTAIAAGLLATAALADPPASTPGKWMARAEAHRPIYADLKTSLGEVVVKLDTQHAPKTVENFVGLAAGEKPWQDPASGEWVKRPLFDGVIFHRVIKGFMIQTGDPTGEGTFTPGFTIDDENTGNFSTPGELAMANRGAHTHTGGSQFFLTVSVPGWLNGGYSIFGKVVAGYDVVKKISEVPVVGSRPTEPVKIEKVTLSEQPPKAAHAAKPSGGKKQ
jgi:peptidyl-prolyl cis-trans isomerase A (cyclophilin A)